MKGNRTVEEQIIHAGAADVPQLAISLVLIEAPTRDRDPLGRGGGRPPDWLRTAPIRIRLPLFYLHSIGRA